MTLCENHRWKNSSNTPSRKLFKESSWQSGGRPHRKTLELQTGIFRHQNSEDLRRKKYIHYIGTLHLQQVDFLRLMYRFSQGLKT